ncbi:hypothetical protein Nepgr_033148 [Nepenthes gracilis]|uniref:Glycosyl transferase CAP10 domain-containing protein n=1 Tax=Nepenthes gracilis TaxID=150966 RepID=A0AAD3Y861_NEPGR|nr:hypothetical protein Nepgr_033147 [Nepenthes gracilis]GMH31305.1 hypothetical protein Nepgr_033148 [Nepenthes gracilis]
MPSLLPLDPQRSVAVEGDRCHERNSREGQGNRFTSGVVILDGRVYLEKYRPAIKTRDVFTLWGILQLLRGYPGRLPDLGLMFDCDDRPAVGSEHFRGPNAGPPPLFRYCSDLSSRDIVFPDWSFWAR